MALRVLRPTSCQPCGDAGWPRPQRTQPWGEPSVPHTDARAGLLGWAQVMGDQPGSLPPQAWAPQSHPSPGRAPGATVTAREGESPAWGSAHSSYAGLTTRNPPHPLQTPAPSPLPRSRCSQTLGNSPRGSVTVPWGWDLGSRPSREPTRATPPELPRSRHVPLAGPAPSSGHPRVCSAGKEASSRQWDVGFYFVSSKYLRKDHRTSQHMRTQRGRRRGCAAAVHIYRGPPEKKRGRWKSRARLQPHQHNTTRT